jgi:hypothetical protein
MRSKFVLCAALIIAAVPVLASFELMLLPGADGRNYRYDPVNNISLGSYRSGTTVITNIAASTAGLAYGSSSSGSAYFVHEYSTGNALPLLNGPNQPLSTDISGNTLYALTGFGTLQRYDLTTGSISTISFSNFVGGAGVTWRTGTVFGGRYYAAGVNGTGNIVLQNINLTTNAVSTAITTTLTAGGINRLGKMAAFRNTSFASADGMFVYQTSGTGFNTFRFDINADGSVPTGTPTTTALLNFGTANFIPATMASHDGFKVVGQDSAVLTNYRINHYSFTTGILTPQTDTFAATGGTRTGYELFQPALIVAPEPGTMIALGLGLAGIMRRRTRKPSA